MSETNGEPRPLTTRQAEVLEFIRLEIEASGSPPTYREIGKRFGISSPHGVVGHLRALEKKRAIDLVHGITRGIRLRNEPDRHEMRRIVESLADGGDVDDLREWARLVLSGCRPAKN